MFFTSSTQKSFTPNNKTFALGDTSSTTTSLYQAAFQSLPIAAAIGDFQHRIFRVNPAFEALFGYSQAEIVGKSAEELYAANDTMRSYFDDIDSDAYVATYRKRDGNVFVGKTQDIPMHDEDNNLVGLLSLVTDISTQHLRDSQVMASAVEKSRINAISQFITHVSHDFRHPLSSINVSTYLIRKKAAAVEGLEQHLNQINFQTKRLSNLVNDLMTMTKLDSGLPLNSEKVDLNQLVRQVVAIYKPEANNKQLLIKMHLEDRTSTVGVVDIAQITKALSNLIMNAIHYTPAGGIVAVRTAVYGRTILIDVQDTGIGIHEEHHTQIFERFFKINAARTTDVHGSGLGLPIARAIVEAHGGHITVQSQPEQGSRFTIRLPIPRHASPK